MIIKLKDGTILESVSVTADAITCEYAQLTDCSAFISAVNDENVSTIEIDGVRRSNVHMRGDIGITVTGSKFVATAFLEFPSELEEIKAQIIELQDALMEIAEG